VSVIVEAVRPAASQRRIWRVARPGVRLGIALPILFLLVILAVFGEAIAPYGALTGSPSQALHPPVFAGGNWTHILGTDAVGRDILSRMILGTRVTMLVAAVTLLVGGVIGSALGLIAGYVRGHFDGAIMRLVDVVLSFPPILPPMLLAAAIGPSAGNVVITISFFIWAPFARQVRAEVVVLREEAFISSARVSAVPGPLIILRHLLPNVLDTIIVLATLQIGWLILAQSMLSFVGAGLPPPAPDWGGMIASGTEYVVRAWWIPTMPGLAIVLTVLAFNLLGDWLQEHRDPRRVVTSS
jgi:peptide/nickel transport system permease protein